MAALFPAWSNTVLRVVLVCLPLLVLALILGLMTYVRTPYSTGQFVTIDQPVEFDHRHHVRDDDIGCLYCHYAAEVSPYAGVPPTELCMGCHAQIWNASPLLEPVRRSYFSGQPIPWNRVHATPDFVYFDHSVHVQYGVDCAVCHGPVEDMPRVYQVESLRMIWCLDCHRDPEAYLASWRQRQPGSGWSATVAQVTPSVLRRELSPLTTCSACHR